MWSHLPVASLTNLQRFAALRQIDERIAQDWEDGYGVDVDELLERRHRIVDQMRREAA